MLAKLLVVLERFQVFCVARLMQSIAKRRYGKSAHPDDTLRTLLPVWNQLATSRSNPLDPALRASARTLLLAQLPPEAWPLIPSLEKRDVPVMNTWNFQNEVMEWNIAKGDLVLDIGAGGWPFKRANHLADKFPGETTHRVESMVRDGRPFFEVDLEHLPFSDHSYDFIFCSHVLEHLENPGQAIRELMRVGQRGYIEVPTRLSDAMFNFTHLPNHHRWHSMVLGDTLVLVEWNDWERRDLGNHFFDALHSPYKNSFQDFFENNRDLFFTSYHWNKIIKYLIIDKQGRVIDLSKDKS